jgi:tetratricopeptide (TPR) repeat protein
MVTEFEELRSRLRDGLRLSRQGSYERRAPAKEAVPYLARARDGLHALLEHEPKNAEAWDLLSQAEAALLNYEPAILALERLIQISSKKDKRVLKRLAGLKQAHSEWGALPLSPAQLAALGEYLEEHGVGSQSKTLELSRRWLEQSGAHDVERVIEALGCRGAFCDFQVLQNVVRG